VRGRELLRHQPTQREATQDDRSGHAEVEDLTQIIAELRERVRAGTQLGQTMSPLIVTQHGPPARQRRHHVVPDSMIGTQAIDEHQRHGAELAIIPAG
jgi:hypothetical protein